MTIARRPIASIEQVDGLQGALNGRPRTEIAAMRNVPGFPLRMFEDDEAWNGGEAVTAEPYVGFGKQSRKITSTGTSVSINMAIPVDERPWAWDFTTYPQMEWLFYCENAAQLQRIWFYCGTSASVVTSGPHFVGSDKTPAEGGQAPEIVEGWNLLRLDKADMVATNGAVDADWANINRVQIAVDALAGQTVSCYFASWRVVKPPAVVFLDFDDADSTVNTALEIADEYGLHCTVYAPTGLIGGEGIYGPTMTWDDLWSAYTRGHDVASHTHLHTDLQALDAAGKKAAIQPAYKALLARGFTRSARWFSSPHGQTDANIAAAVAAFHETNRPASGSGDSNKYPVVDKYQFGHVYNAIGTSTASLATVKGWVTTAKARGHLIHLLSHGIGSREAYDTTEADWRELCRWLAEDAGVVVMTLSEFYDQGLATIGGVENVSPTQVSMTPLGTLATTRKA